MRKWIKTSLISLLLGSLALSGCGKEQVAEEAITLIDPVSVFVSSENAEYRNIYNAEVYSTSVFPVTQEYSFGESASFQAYEAFPGSFVNAGERLAYLNTENLQDRIEDMEEQLVNLDKQYQEQVSEINKKITTAKENMDFCGRTGGSYLLTYEKELLIYENQLKELEYATSVYQLDRSYQEHEIKKLEEKKQKYELIATKEGNVVAIGDYGFGSQLNTETMVMAIGDLNQKQLKCNYINKSTISRADDVYAMFNGKRIEVEYQPMDADEYTKLSKQGASIYSTFLLGEGAEEINVGDFGVIVVVTDKKENVLTVSSSAVHRDTTGSFVYVVKDGVSISTPVKVGVSDGQYTEILDGITPEDNILLDEMRKYGDKTTTVTKGEFNSQFEGVGYMYYVDQKGIMNTLDYGTMYLEEMKVSQYQHVNKGDVICTVRLVQDNITLERYENELKRLKERLTDIQSEIPEDETKQQRESREKAVTKKNEEIAKIQEMVDEIKAIEGVHALYAETDGIVINIDRTLESQSILSKNQVIVTIANESNCYVVVEDPNQLLNYGNTVDIQYISINGQDSITQGTVANLSKAGVSQTLEVPWKIIRLPKEIIGDMAASQPGEDGWWNRSLFGVNATIREMKNVLIVPKGAVTDIGGKTYVDVIDENGNIMTTSFIAGGYDNENYWVVEGLTEGMKVCLK